MKLTKAQEQLVKDICSKMNYGRFGRERCYKRVEERGLIKGREEVWESIKETKLTMQELLDEIEIEKKYGKELDEIEDNLRL